MITIQRIGFLQVYNEIDWINYAIEHALKLCDKLIIIEGSQFSSFKNIPERSNDGTLEIIHKWFDEYPKEIELINTIRKNPNYRENQASNFNLVLKKCEKGDYLIPLDADEFYFKYIKKIIEITEEGKIDYLISTGPNFAFSFNWRLILSSADLKYKQTLFKKNNKLKFVKTHKPVKHGPNKVVDESGDCLVHYKWVRPYERMFIRHLTSGFYDNMVDWFDKNWNKIDLKENKKYNYYGGYFYLEKYDGPHPKILDSHPWRLIEDIRKKD